MIHPTLARSIRLVGLDVDGVLTDGGIYLGATDGKPVELKRYEIQDGLGIHLLQRTGVRVAIITGRVSESVRLRAAELGIDDVAQDSQAQKLPAFLSMLDFPDMAVLKLVGLPVAVANAVLEVKAACSLTLTRCGGAGAVREFAELLMKARGDWLSVTDRYVAERSLPLAELDR